MNPKPPRTTRRRFLGAAAALPIATPGVPTVFVRRRRGPIAVASGNGLRTVQIAVEQMNKGARPVDAAVTGVNVVELDPNDTSVGYGGLPNAEGVVELDSCVMDGPTHLAGAVAALRNIKTPSRVALKVMRRTDHVLLVGQGALAFARAHGFAEHDLLTERARQRWLQWKERLSERDDWIEEGGNELPEARDKARREGREEEERDPGTIHCSTLDAAGRVGACTTTSGLAFKIPGRVGDSPLIGCGLYVDNDVGSAGSTGRGEATILSNGSFSVVEHMRQGMSPTDACLAVLRRVVHYTRIPRLLNEQQRPDFNLAFYAVSKNGHYGAATIYPSRYTICNEEGAQRLGTASLFESRRR